MSEQELHMAYTSQLAADQDYSVFAAICRVARKRNLELGIAGVLVFDGVRFFQWLHGPQPAVAELMATIALDTRHTGFAMCLEEHLPATAQPAVWRSGFVEPETLDDIERATGEGSEAMLDAIARMLEVADLEPLQVRRGGAGHDGALGSAGG